MSTAAPAPKDTGAAGRRLWRAVTTAFDLEQHELELLRQTVAVLDNCESLQGVVNAQGMLSEDRATAATVELRLQRVLLVKLLADLRVPDSDDTRPSQRPGSRGAYGRRGST